MNEEDILEEANKKTPSYIEIMHIKHRHIEHGITDRLKERRDCYRARDKRIDLEVDFTADIMTPSPVLTVIHRAYTGLTQKYNASLMIEQRRYEEDEDKK